MSLPAHSALRPSPSCPRPFPAGTSPSGGTFTLSLSLPRIPQPRMSSYTMMSVLIMIRGTTTRSVSMSRRRVSQQWPAGPTPHDRPHARNQLYDLVPDARVGVLAEAALVGRGGEPDCVAAVSFPVYLGAAALGLRILPPKGDGRVRCRDVPRARKRSSEGMQMALRRRTVTEGERGC